MRKIFRRIKLIIFVILIGFVIYFVKNNDINKYINLSNIENKDIITNDLQNSNSVYYYNKLSEYDQKIYNKILKGISKLESNITLDITTNLEKDELFNDISKVFSYVLADHPEIWYVKPNYGIKISNYLGINVVMVNMEYNVSNINDMKAEVNEISDKINNIINKVIKTNMTDYDKALFIHDYLAENIVYYKYTDVKDIPSDKHNAYSALINNSAVCDGFTKAYQLILNELNIQNIFIEGTTGDVAHAWNLVKLDSEYYHIDLTSNTTLMGNQKDNLPVHVYFNITDNDILETHTIEKRELLPSAVATKYNYYKIEEKEITYKDNFDNALEKIIKNNKNSKLLEVKITDVYNATSQFVNELYAQNYNKMKTNNIKKVEYNKILNIYIVTKN